MSRPDFVVACVILAVVFGIMAWCLWDCAFGKDSTESKESRPVNEK